MNAVVSISRVGQNFGAWFRRLVDRSVRVQKDFSDALGMTLKAMRDAFGKEEMSFRGSTVQALLRIVGLHTEAELRQMVEEDRFPDEVMVVEGIARCMRINASRAKLKDLPRGSDLLRHAASQAKPLAKKAKTKRESKGK